MSEEYHFEVEGPGRDYDAAEFCQKTACYRAAIAWASEWMAEQVDDAGIPGEVSVTVRVQRGPLHERCINCNPEPSHE